LTHVYLIRHGDYVFDLQDGKYRDLGLTPEGVRQTECLRDRLLRTGEIKPDVLIASTMRRAHETATILAPALGCPIILDKEVEEWRNEDGSLSPEEFTARWQQVPEPQRPFFRWVPGGENWLEFSVRAQLALNRILQEHEGKTIVIVCHGNVIEASFVYFFGLSGATLQRAPVAVKHTAITHWFRRADEQTWLLERYNDYHHLSP
jgi:probable phosphoglycerate mutase